MAIDCSAGFGQADMPPDSSLRPVTPHIKNATLIIHFNALELPRALIMLGRQFLRGKKVIGYWAWELPEMPLSWRSGFPFVHTIWCCSHFTRDAIAKHTAKPVITVHNVVMPYHGALAEKDDKATNLFVVLVMANADSSLTRKNPFDAIAAFKKAFGDDPTKILLLHIGRLDSSPLRRGPLMAALGSAPNIKLLEKPLSPAARHSLMRRANVILSLHRAEGFGLVLAQAMLEAKPVIATGWSGNLDFMNDTCAALIPFTLVPVDDPFGIYKNKGQFWAQPDVDAAAAWLQRLADNPQEAETMGQKAATHIKTMLNSQNYAKQAGL